MKESNEHCCVQEDKEDTIRIWPKDKHNNLKPSQGWSNLNKVLNITLGLMRGNG